MAKTPTPVKKTTPMKNRGTTCASTPNSPSGGRGTPRRAAANGAVERMRKMHKEDMDVDGAFDDDDEDYDRSDKQGTGSKASTPRKTYRARVNRGSAPTTPMSKRYVYWHMEYFRVCEHAGIRARNVGDSAAETRSRSEANYQLIIRFRLSRAVSFCFFVRLDVVIIFVRVVDHICAHVSCMACCAHSLRSACMTMSDTDETICLSTQDAGWRYAAQGEARIRYGKRREWR